MNARIKEDGYLVDMREVGIVVLFMSYWVGCAPAAERLPEQVAVQHRGALRTVMRQGDVSAVAQLDSLSEVENLYALGALADLKGEVLVLAGEPYMAMANVQGGVRIDSSFGYGATLLVYSEVAAWDEYPVPDSVVDFEGVEGFVAATAKQAGFSRENAFPFLLVGMAAEVAWHVVNWPSGDSVHTHQKHIDSGPHGTEYNMNGQFLGFYSEHHTGIFTHHTTAMHIHGFLPDAAIAGHIDDLKPGASMVLKLPR